MIQITKGVHADKLIVMIRFYHLKARIYKITPVGKKLEPFISQINPYAMFEGWLEQWISTLIIIATIILHVTT